MSFPIQITHHGLEPSDSLDALIRDEASKLEKFFDGIVSCRVLVERPDGHHQSGAPYHLRLNLVVPGADLAIVGEPSVDRAALVREAFRRARRRLQEYARRRAATHLRPGIR